MSATTLSFVNNSESTDMTLFVDQLTVMDFSYLDERRGIVGESWIVDIYLDGRLNEQGMIFDFGHVKKQIKAEIDTLFDHKLIIPKKLPSLEVTHSDHDTEISWVNQQGQKCLHSSPKSAVVVLDTSVVTIEDAKEFLEKRLRHVLPANATNLRLEIYSEFPDKPTDSSITPYYHYSHGLRKHLGDCQRIAHGHRSKIEIYENEQRAPAKEREWCKQWEDIYIGTKSDLVDTLEKNMYRFEYQAEQGRFMIQLAKTDCYLVETESTVEQLAIHIAEVLKQRTPNSSFRVRAYEGVKKGAIAIR
ncbi:MAG: 6-carboxytetrahydropterin synthase [Pseudomonadales bacterium]|nr:6-carboxytetrahydropterin synthase [Pseudomonadales bacterium]